MVPYHISQSKPIVFSSSLLARETLPYSKLFSGSDLNDIKKSNGRAYIIRNDINGNGKIIGFVSAQIYSEGMVHIGPLAVATNHQVYRARLIGGP